MPTCGSTHTCSIVAGTEAGSDTGEEASEPPAILLLSAGNYSRAVLLNWALVSISSISRVSSRPEDDDPVDATRGLKGQQACFGKAGVVINAGQPSSCEVAFLYEAMAFQFEVAGIYPGTGVVLPKLQYLVLLQCL